MYTVIQTSLVADADKFLTHDYMYMYVPTVYCDSAV